MRLRIDDDTRFEYSGSVDTGTNPRSAESAASRSIRYTPTRLLEPLLCNSDARLLTNCWYWSVPVRFEAFRCFWTRTICDEKSLRESSVACFSTDPLMTYMETKTATRPSATPPASTRPPFSPAMIGAPAVCHDARYTTLDGFSSAWFAYTVGATNLYPIPRTVCTIRGFSGSVSTFMRSRCTCTLTNLVSPPLTYPQTRFSKFARLRASPA